MSLAVTLPAPPGPYLDSGLLPGDFYSYQDLLSAPEREVVGRLRDFLRIEVAPIVNDHWARAEFPFQLFEGFAKLELLTWADPQSLEPKPSNLLQGIIGLELAHADPSIATGFGVHSGLAMGSILACADEKGIHFLAIRTGQVRHLPGASKEMPDLKALAFTPNGKTLIAVRNQARWSILDSRSLAIVESSKLLGYYEPEFTLDHRGARQFIQPSSPVVALR